MTPPEIDDGMFRGPCEWMAIIVAYRVQLIQARASNLHLNLRHRDQKKVLEMEQAAYFGYAYAVVHGLFSLTIKPEATQSTDCDVVFQWVEGGEIYTVPVQLKELPSREYDRKEKESVDGILKKLALKLPTARNLIVAIFLNREQFFDTVTTPILGINQLWFWGYSKPQKAEMFLSGGDHRGSKRYTIAITEDGISTVR